MHILDLQTNKWMKHFSYDDVLNDKKTNMSNNNDKNTLILLKDS